MATQSHLKEIEIAANELVVLPNAPGVRVDCLAGSVWLTLHHDRRDVVLNPGDRFVIDRNGDTLVQALAPARLRLDATQSSAVASVAGAWPSLKWLRRGAHAALTARWVRAAAG